MLPRVLIIAGSDSGGGAGIQADIKTVTLLGAYASTALTALTAQNTLGVFGVFPVEPSFVAEQIRVVLEDIGADAIKTGMLFSKAIVETVVRELEARSFATPIVVDPVMVAKGGAALLERDAQRAIVERLFPIASLITPNVPEAEALTGLEVRHADDLPQVAERLLVLGPAAVLVKGGHLRGDRVVDLLRTADGQEVRFEGPRVHTRSTHGTGCTLASAIAASIAEGLTLEASVARARAYLEMALKTAPGIGAGHGPLNHGWPITERTNGNGVPGVRVG